MAKKNRKKPEVQHVRIIGAQREVVERHVRIVHRKAAAPEVQHVRIIGAQREVIERHPVFVKSLRPK